MGPVLLGMALALWLTGMLGRRRQNRQTGREIRETLQTGMPTEETALGRKAREIAASQADKLRSPPPIHGNARWATAEDAEALLALPRSSMIAGSRGIRLGALIDEYSDTTFPIEARYPGHLLTVAATGQGKSATQIVETLLSYRGAVVVVDPKGELFDLTARDRSRFGPVHRLAPYATSGQSSRYNPLEELGEPREMGSRARQLAEMLIVRQGEKGAAEASFFENEAINLLTLVIMAVVEWTDVPGRRALRTLQEVRRICTLPILAGRKEREPGVREYLEDTLKLMGKCKSLLVRQQSQMFLGYEQKLLSAFVSEINSNLAFFDGHPGFAEATATSDFAFADLADANGTVYLTIPLKDIHISYRYLRAMIGMAFAALREQRDATEASVLFILDEFAALKDMEFMRSAVAQMRSSGAWFWFFVQDVAQLRGIYREWANVFLSQTDHQVFFGAVNDPETKRHISTNLGVETFAYRDAHINWSQNVGLSDGESLSPTSPGSHQHGRSIGQSMSVSDPVVLAPKPLLTPFEVGTFLAEREPGQGHATTAIVFTKQAGGYPLKLRRRHWRSTMQTDMREARSAGTR